MRNATAGLLLAIGIALFSSLSSAKAEEIDPDHAALRALAAVYEQAIKESKPELLKPHMADDFSGVMVDGDQIKDYAALDAYWKKIKGLMGEGGTYSVKVNFPQPAQIIGDLAYAYGTTEDHVVTSAGKEYDFTGRWTAICRRTNGEWKIVRIHGSMDPIYNEFVLASVKTASYTAGGIAGGIGLLVGIALAKFIGRKRSATPAKS